MRSLNVPKAELLEVENLESMNEIQDEDQILKMLMPN